MTMQSGKFLTRSQKMQIVRKMINYYDHIKIRNFCVSDISDIVGESKATK